VGDIDAEIAIYEDILRTDSHNVWARENLGSAFIDRKEPRRALVHLRIAEKVKPDSARIKRNIRTASRAYDRLRTGKVLGIASL
jgi:hypothetical protein